ncbi:unnamed protein product [Brassica rapa]|uniref:Di19 zinc-binding domain-containing protein n=1 Tax=Brassica campestris TaxID=3711 RepID=A0A3P6B3G0_BRACM|nr:unnamed protein product [Brassica rapa]VDC92510.1 unnamed protein product [Brassica rapa]
MSYCLLLFFMKTSWGYFREDYAFPFCSEYFDIVSLCCHIDEDYPMDTINGVNTSSILFCYIKI